MLNCQNRRHTIDETDEFCRFLSTGAWEGGSPVTEKDLKKLNRYQLLEMLIIQTERADDLQRQLEQAQEQLNSREVQMTVIGSIAEASLQLSGVFDAAQTAADMYLSAAKDRAAAMEAEAAATLELARHQAQEILRTARQNAGASL